MKCKNCGAEPRPAGGFTGGQQHSAGWPKHRPVTVEPCQKSKCAARGEHEHVRCSDCGHAETKSSGGTNA